MPESAMPLTEDMIKDIYNHIVDTSSSIISGWNPLTSIGTYDELKESADIDPDGLVDNYLKLQMMFGFASHPDKKIKIYNPSWHTNGDEYINDNDIMMYAICLWLCEDGFEDFVFNKIFNSMDIAYVIDFYSADVEDYFFYEVNFLRMEYIDSNGELQEKWIDYPTKFNISKFVYAIDHELLSLDFAFYEKDEDQDILSDFDRAANFYAVKNKKTIDEYVISHLDMPEDIKHVVTDNFWRLMVAPY